ncbi:Stemmadenine O-acetyltransferase [Linum perenne]
MEISILSREIIKPSNPNIQSLPPLKLNLLDQLTPSSYSPLILFYQNNNQANISHISKQLKWSLSEALTLHYPVGGRVRDNFIIDDFCEGIPFVEARVKCSLCDFLYDQDVDSDHGVELLNNLLPLQAQRLVLDDAGPQIVVQLNVFECGGLALGFCSLHKTLDGVAARGLLRTWSTINNGRIDDNQMVQRSEIIQPDFSQGVLTFPPVRSLPPEYTSLVEGIWFGSKGKPVTRRFVFNTESISKLRLRSRSQALENPTRADAISAFLWKSIILATASLSHNGDNYYNSSMLSQTINIRRLTRPRLSNHSFGNLITYSGSTYDPRINGEPKLGDLAGLVRSGVSEMNSELLGEFVGESGTKAIFNYCDELLLEMSSEDEKAADKLNVSCLHGFGMSKIDFGWGPTVWVTRSGPGGASRGEQNDVIFYTKDTVILVENNHGGLEAWLTLEEPAVMSALETDPEFLEFASMKSAILV